MKKIIALLLAVLFAVSLCACKEKKENKKAAPGEVRTWFLGGSNGLSKVDPEKLFKNYEDTIDPDDIYASVKITEEMLHGAYTLNNTEEDIKELKKNNSYKKYDFSNGSYNVIPLPASVCFGKDYILSSAAGYDGGDFQNCTDCEVAKLGLQTKDGLGSVICKYKVNGNKVKFTELEQTSEYGEKLTYEVGKFEIEYEFSIKGPFLTLTHDKKSVELVSYGFSENCEDTFEITGYSLPDSPLIDELDYFHASEDGTIDYAAMRDGNYYDLSAFKVCDDGRITVYLSNKDEDGKEKKFIKQYAYIAQSDGSDILNWVSLVLLDGEKEYYYTDDISMREARQLDSEGLDTSKLSDDEIKEIAQKKSDLYDDLSTEFQNKGINVSINRATGEIAMDATVLFGGDSAEITNDGKDLLNKFVSAYTTIIYKEKYEGFISKTLIEGHTAPVSGSTYESGLPLSVERANNVKNYCISPETGVDTSKLAATLEAVGCSNSKPVYGSNGEIDLAACRRVSFKFVININ